ncbi:MAG: hypothetical protein C5B54_09245 [Acidobacteria bacterium]|nr:MAG: hypothetical protein C5B54_09245 [Acidobacteriota bacterium]
MQKLIILFLLLLFFAPLLVANAGEAKNVAILLFDGVQIIDYTAPYEVFGQAHYNVYTVAEKPSPINTSMNMTVTPKYDFSNAPQPYLLVLPGGNVDPQLQHAAVLDWVKKSANQATYVLTVCNGAFFAGKVGLLDGLTATTFHGLITQLQELAPKAKVVRNKRFVDNGKIITSAGLTSGMDSSLYVVSKIEGMQAAKELALHLEYNWDPESKYARAALADRYLEPINFNPPDDSGWKTLTNYGDLNHWEYRASTKKPSPAELMKTVSDQVESLKWKKKSQAENEESWSFQGDDGQPWNAAVRIEKGSDQTYTVTFQVNRAS